MALTPEKKIEILERVLEEYLEKEKIQLSPVQIRRDLGNFSAKTRICFNDLCEVLSPIAEKILKKSFAEKKVGREILLSNPKNHRFEPKAR